MLALTEDPHAAPRAATSSVTSIIYVADDASKPLTS